MSPQASGHIPVVPIEEYERQQRRRESGLAPVWDALDSVKDPEVPAISLWELGVLQDIEQVDGRIVVTITPTYSGCPAMAAMAEDVVETLRREGFSECEVRTRLSPAWTTRWMSATARRKLREHGIAPPVETCADEAPDVVCPQCGTGGARLLSQFGSTACKAMYRCLSCAEIFDFFKQV